MTVQTELHAADRALKEKHRVMWALGDYPTVASQVIPTLGPVLVDACEVGPGDRVLDAAAGSGNVATPAALTGATVTANDLTPELLEAGATVAGRHGIDIRWETGDAEALPYPDDRPSGAPSGSTGSPHPRSSATSSRPTAGRPSPRTEGWPTSRTGRRLSIRTWSSWRGATASAPATR